MISSGLDMKPGPRRRMPVRRMLDRDPDAQSILEREDDQRDKLDAVNRRRIAPPKPAPTKGDRSQVDDDQQDDQPADYRAPPISDRAMLQDVVEPMPSAAAVCRPCRVVMHICRAIYRSAEPTARQGIAGLRQEVFPRARTFRRGATDVLRSVRHARHRPMPRVRWSVHPEHDREDPKGNNDH